MRIGRGAGVRLSMGSTGDCYDNALCESFFATLECELIDRSGFATRRDVSATDGLSAARALRCR